MMVGLCGDCNNWTVARVTKYGDGSEVVNWRAPEGEGGCSVLKTNTAADFGCTKFAPLATSAIVVPGSRHVVRDWKNGAPWQHHVVGPCPDCKGRGSDGGPCHRCAGTGKVRYYDDGFIGEEQTRLHPKEREHVEPLRCKTCSEVVDVKWKACPMCGTRLEPVAETEYVGGLGNEGGDYRRNGSAARENLKADIDAMNDRSERIAACRRMTVENGCTEAEVATAAAMADKLEAMRDHDFTTNEHEAVG